MTVWRAIGHPAAPAALTLVASAAVLVLLPGTAVACVVLAWTLLGVTAGYSISGSV